MLLFCNDLEEQIQRNAYSWSSFALTVLHERTCINSRNVSKSTSGSAHLSRSFADPTSFADPAVFFAMELRRAGAPRRGETLELSTLLRRRAMLARRFGGDRGVLGFGDAPGVIGFCDERGVMGFEARLVARVSLLFGLPFGSMSNRRRQNPTNKSSTSIGMP